jgi:hypothetical protein
MEIGEHTKERNMKLYRVERMIEAGWQQVEVFESEKKAKRFVGCCLASSKTRIVEFVR